MFHIKYENKNSNLKFGCQILKLNFGGHIQKNCWTHWTFSAFTTSISGTLQCFDYDQWPREIKLAAILQTCLNYFLLLDQSEYSLELTSSLGTNWIVRVKIWLWESNMKRHSIGPASSKNSTACTRGFSALREKNLWQPGYDIHIVAAVIC